MTSNILSFGDSASFLMVVILLHLVFISKSSSICENCELENSPEVLSEVQVWRSRSQFIRRWSRNPIDVQHGLMINFPQSDGAFSCMKT